MSEIIRIQNIESYTQETLILTADELSKISFTKSNIKDCTIRNGEKIISEKRKKYRTILDDIWNSMPTQKILQTTTFNIKLTDEKGIHEKGFKCLPKKNMSFQSKDANGCMKEIIKQIKVNKYSIKISIQLENKKIVIFEKEKDEEEQPQKQCNELEKLKKKLEKLKREKKEILEQYEMLRGGKNDLISEICQWTGRNYDFYKKWSYEDIKQRHEGLREEYVKSLQKIKME